MQRLKKLWPQQKNLQWAVGAAVLAMTLAVIYFSEIARRYSYEQEPVWVVVATHDIRNQQELLPSDVALQSVPRRYVQPGALRQLERAVGLITTTSIPSGSQITVALTLPPSAHAGLAGLLSAGQRAVTVAVDDVNGVAGFLRPGNRVDCLMTLDFGNEMSSQFTTFTVLSDVPILAVNRTVTPPALEPPTKSASSEIADAGSSGRQLVTVAVSADDAQMLLLAQESGRMHLLLRPQEEPTASTPEPMTLERLTRMRNMVRLRARPTYTEYRGGH